MSDQVKDETDIYQNEESKLKEVAKTLQADSDKDSESLQGQVTSSNQRSSSKTKKDSGRKNSSRYLLSSDDSDIPLGQVKSRKKILSTKNSGTDNSDKEDLSKPTDEVKSSEPVKPVLKVRSFAKMLSENVLKKNETVDEKKIDEENRKNSSQCDVYTVETDSDQKSVDGDATSENKKKKNLSNSDSENSETMKGSNRSVKGKNQHISDVDLEKSETTEGKSKNSVKGKKEDSSEEVSDKSETAKGKGKRLEKEKKKKKADFENFRQKREKFLKSANSREEKKERGLPRKGKNDVLESSDSEGEQPTKTQNSKRIRSRKAVIDTSDEEKERTKKTDEEESDSKSEKEEAEMPESDSGASVQTKGVSSGETSSDENVKLKKKRRKAKRDSSEDEDDGDNDDDDDDDSGNKKKKGRKNIKKILKKDSLHVETKEALKNEEERRKRLEVRQKLFEETFPEDSDKTDEPKRLILDFDPETKKPLVSVHKKLVKKLKPHQVKGVKFMWDNCFESVQRLEEDSGSGCILAHCMGLGKTLQVVTFVHTIMTHDLGVSTVLIACPLSTVKNWVHEFEMWLSNIHTDPITLYDLVKYKKFEERAYNLKDWQENGGVLIISYDLFRTLTKGLTEKGKKTTKKMKLFETTLLDPGPDLVVCDEGHLLKNEDTALSKCMNLIKTSRRIVLTGTPLQNNLMEYHCMVQFVKPNILGTKKEFSNRFVNPIVNGQFEDSTELDVKIMKRRSHVLHSMLSGCVQRFDYSVLTPFLPEKHEYVLSVSLTESQAKAYRYFITNLAARATGTTKTANLFNDYHSLQRIWTHPRTMLMQSEKESQKEFEESDTEGSLKDFVVDSDESESSAKSTSSSNSSTNSSAVVKEAPVRKRVLRSNANDPEVQKTIEEEEKSKHWWNEFFKDSDHDDIRASNKLVILFSLLKHCSVVKDKVLVFSQSLYSLDLIEFFLNKVDEANDKDELVAGFKDRWVLGLDYFRLDGRTSSENRAIWCKQFNKESNTRARLFLISTRAGGLGINLYGANRVVVFDASWNPSHDLQSIFRVYRFGQKKTCYIYRFLAEATMEEKIYERQVTKLSLAHRVVDEYQIERHYSMMNLQELYKFEPTPVEQRKVPKLPKDAIFAELLSEHKDVIVGYHEHDSLLENKQDEELSEEERKAAWKEYEEEKVQRATNFSQMLANMAQGMSQISPSFSDNAWLLNPAYFGQIAAGQSQPSPSLVGPSIPLDIIRRGMNVGIAPLHNESPDMFMQRLNFREHWMSVGPRET